MSAMASKSEAEQGEPEDLHFKGFGGSDPDFRAGAHLEVGIRFAGDSRAGDIDDSEGAHALGARGANGSQGIGGFAGLRD